MFSSPAGLERKTPANGINRKEFIAHLVEEYYTTTNIEAQEQVSANLSNFAYDPINWTYLKNTGAFKLFKLFLEHTNERIRLHGSAGLCNISLDSDAISFITQIETLRTIQKLFKDTENYDIILNLATLFYQILLNSQYHDSNLKNLFATPEILKKLTELKQSCADQRIVNIASIFLEDFGTRHLVVGKQNSGEK